MNIDEQPLEYQVQYWRLRAQNAEAELKREKKRKTPEQLTALEEELRISQERTRFERGNSERWQDVAKVISEQVTEKNKRIALLETEGAAGVLTQERDNYKRRLESAQKRIADMLERLPHDYVFRVHYREEEEQVKRLNLIPPS